MKENWLLIFIGIVAAWRLLFQLGAFNWMERLKAVTKKGSKK
jgi:hypothetical protein